MRGVPGLVEGAARYRPLESPQGGRELVKNGRGRKRDEVVPSIGMLCSSSSVAGPGRVLFESEVAGGGGGVSGVGVEVERGLRRDTVSKVRAQVDGESQAVAVTVGWGVSSRVWWLQGKYPDECAGTLPVPCSMGSRRDVAGTWVPREGPVFEVACGELVPLVRQRCGR